LDSLDGNFVLAAAEVQGEEAKVEKLQVEELSGDAATKELKQLVLISALLMSQLALAVGKELGTLLS
jgi:hypothetical protein